MVYPLFPFTLAAYMQQQQQQREYGGLYLSDVLPYKSKEYQEGILPPPEFQSHGSPANNGVTAEQQQQLQQRQLQQQHNLQQQMQQHGSLSNLQAQNLTLTRKNPYGNWTWMSRHEIYIII